MFVSSMRTFTILLRTCPSFIVEGEKTQFKVLKNKGWTDSKTQKACFPKLSAHDIHRIIQQIE